jgi:hypothetical protein
MDHRRLQRTLFRMQHDPAFAAALRAGAPDAAASTGLGADDLGRLRAADPVALAADREGRRAAQLLRNVSSEFRLAAALGPAGDGDAGWVGGFPRSREFHCAVSEGKALPLAFADWAEALAARAPCAVFRALVALEAALARARRAGAPTAERAGGAPLPPGAVVRVAGARLVALPAGTHASAAALAPALDAGAPLPVLAVDEGARETLLVALDPGADARFGRLPALRVEPLPPRVADLLRRAERPLDRAGRAAFAAAHELDADEVEAVVAEYVAEGVLRAGA